ncbi:6-bladed beta-propeller [Rhodohalobacter sp. SW132]|uniref:BF3164 family lipoprotein n=1 Tax=Rhodohalobacter sp. SW132 TaxID=2293433 RepID=UPI000E286DC4|nr:BF3164 family lipoprotein [Rhodohalobacter sp. SW132]REL37988.1 6-bladed beta-propeller [Rhodohalobacter sp. SW132]
MPEKMNLNQTRQFVALFFFLFTAFGCNSDNEVSVFEDELNYKPVEVKSSFSFSEIFNPNTIRIIDGKLYVTEAQNPDVSFHVLNTDSNTHSLIYEKGLGTRGEGPGEFLEINDIIATDSLIYIYDGNQLKMVSYDPASGELASYNDIHLRTTGRPASIYSFTNEQFIGIGLFFGSRFITMDSNGETISEFGDLIEFNQDFSRRDLALGWRSNGTVHPDEPYVYLFSVNADFIEMYDGDGNLIKRIQGAQNPEPNMEIRNEWPFNAGAVSYVNIDSNENYIYGLYSGQLWDDERLSGNIIHKYDWDLNLIDAYKLDRRFNQITVDENGNLYTFGETDEGIEFYVYELF